MARVVGPYFPKGCIDDLQFYKMEGKQYVRAKSSLKGKKVKTHRAFARTRASYGRLGKASPIAADVYWQLPAVMRIDGYYEKMVGVVMKLIKEGYTPEEAQAILYEAAKPEHYERARTADMVKASTAAGVAAAVYGQLPVRMHVAGYLKAMTDIAMQLLEEGFGAKQAYKMLHEAAMPEGMVITTTRKIDTPVQKAVAITEISSKYIPANSFADRVFRKVFEGYLAESAEYVEIRNKERICGDMPPQEGYGNIYSD